MLFNWNIAAQKEKLIGDFKANREKYFYLGIFLILLFITLLYLGPFEGLRGFGLFGLRKEREQPSYALTEVMPGSSIITAVAAASPGDVLSIHAGTYAEAVTVNKPLTLQAWGDGDVWLDGQCAFRPLEITASGVTIRGLKFKKAETSAIKIAGANDTTIDGVYIQDYNCSDLGDQFRAGIAAHDGSARLSVTNSTIIRRVELPGPLDGFGNGIWFKNISTSTGGGHYIADNVIIGGYDGVGGEPEDSDYGGVYRDTTIERNKVSDCNDDGIQPEGGNKNVMVRHNLVERCLVGVGFAPSIIGPLYVENNVIRDLQVRRGHNPNCYKIGDGGGGQAYVTENDCQTALANGFGQTNPGLGVAIISSRNILQVGRYVIDMSSSSPPAATSFDFDCMWTTDSSRFVKWANVTYSNLAKFQAAMGQEPNGQQTQDCSFLGPPATPTPVPTPTPGPSPTPSPPGTPVPSPTPPPTQEVTSLTLINADTDLAVSAFDLLSDGATLDFAVLGTDKLNIVANTSPAIVGSVKFGLDSNSNFSVENGAPYALAGNSGTNFNPWTPSLGNHTVTATPYTGTGASGTAGTALNVSFTVEDSTAVASPTPTPTSTPTPLIIDSTAPTAPSNLAAVAVSSNQVNLSWIASTDDVGVSGYKIIRNGLQIATSSTTSFGDATVSAGTVYDYWVIAYDAAGNNSAPSNTATVTTPPPPVASLIFNPTDDAYVWNNKPTNNYGAATALQVDDRPLNRSLFKFSVLGVGGRRVVSAKLQLYSSNSSNKGGYFHNVANTTWSEKTVTWNNAPAFDASVLASLGIVASGRWYEVDVTSLVTGDGIYSLLADSDSKNGANFYSKEKGLGFAPRLVVTVQQ